MNHEGQLSKSGVELRRIWFDGPAFDQRFDSERLTSQIQRIFALMRDERWRTLAEIEELTGDPAASISAQLRHLRKDRFGAHTVERRARGDRSNGLFEYRLVVAFDSKGQRELFA